MDNRRYNLNEIMIYKNKIMKLLVESPTIVSAINNTDIDVPEELAWTNLFPLYRVPSGTQTKELTYICFDLFAPIVESQLYKQVQLNFYIFTHNNLQRTGNGYVLTDYIQCEVDKIFNHSADFGIGLLELKSQNPLKVTDDYMGSQLAYRALNFNQIKGNY